MDSTARLSLRSMFAKLAWSSAAAALLAGTGCKKPSQESGQSPPTAQQPLLDAHDFILNYSVTPPHAVPINGKAAPVRTVNPGAVNLTTGELVVCDPGNCTAKLPLGTKLPARPFPVYLTLVTLPGTTSERVAFARVKLADGPAKTWRRAPLATPGALNDFEVKGTYAAFIDKASTPSLGSPGAPSQDAISQQAQQQDAGKGRWVNFALGADANGGNFIAFEPGSGRDRYRTYLGYSETGALVAIVIDFRVITV